jgi:hypothetical protein
MILNVLKNKYSASVPEAFWKELIVCIHKMVEKFGKDIALWPCNLGQIQNSLGEIIPVKCSKVLSNTSKEEHL